MLRKAVIGPTLEELRPLKHELDKAQLEQRRSHESKNGGAHLPTDFPVYPRIVEELRDARGPVPHRTARHVCAVLSAWSYSDADTLAQMMARLGLFKNRCLFAEVSNHGLLVRSTAYLVQSECRTVALLAYRGTDPFDFSTWAVSSDVNPVMVPVRDNAQSAHDNQLPIKNAGREKRDAARVHGGFYRNQRATWFALTKALKRAAYGESILTNEWLDELPKEQRSKVHAEREDQLTNDWVKRRHQGVHPVLFVTGHSLGGAMATIAAYKMMTDPSYVDMVTSLAQVYTFGQPMVGNEAFKRAWNDTPLAAGLFCHNHQSDVVPHLPPHDTKQFVHVGAHYQSVERKDDDPSTPEWTWSDKPVDPPEQAPSWTDIATSFVEFVGVQVPVVGKLIELAYAVGGGVESGMRAVQVALDRVPIIKRIVPDPGPRRARYSIYDHIPGHYVACSQPNGVLTEFGDDF